MWIGSKKHIPTPVIGVSAGYDAKIAEIEQSDNQLDTYLETIRE